MFYSANFRVGLSMLTKSSLISNKAILSIFQDIAEMHSASVGYGVTDIEKTNYSWAILNWKVEILSRPKYGDVVTIKTWSRYHTKLYCYRDFEMLNSDGKVIGIATSKWVLINIKNSRISKIEDELIDKYNSEEKSVFGIIELPKLEDIPNYQSSKNFPIRKSDIDINEHMNNLCYLDIAEELLPEDLLTCNKFEIMYKKQIKIDDNVTAFYGVNNNENYIVVKSNNGNIVHTIMKFGN